MKRARGRNSNSGQYTYEAPRRQNSQTPAYNRQAEQHLRKQSTAAVRPNTKRKPKKKKKNQGIKAIFIIILLAVAAFFVAMGMGWSGSDDEGALIPVDMEKGKLNVLLLGVDKEGLRTDAMMLVSYDLKNPGAKLISIPRDTQFKITDRSVTRKINEIHAMHDYDNNLVGPMGSVKAVTALTSVPIHYYIEINFDAIDQIADILGGVEFDVPDIEGGGKGMNYDDPVQDLHIHLKPGLQTLKGNEIQQFIRYRKSNSGTTDGSDTSRVERQQELLKAMVEQKVNLGLIAKVPSIYSKIKKNMKTNFSSGEALKYAKYLNGLESSAIQTYSLPGESKKVGKAWYFVCDFEETAQLIRSEFEYDALELTNKITINDVSGTKKVLTSTASNSKKDDDTNSSKEESSSSKSTPTPKEEEKNTEVGTKNNKNDDNSSSQSKTETEVTTPTDSPKSNTSQNTEKKENIVPIKTPTPQEEQTPPPAYYDDDTDYALEDEVVTLD